MRRAGAARHAGSMENALAALSQELAGAVDAAGRAVVAVNARHRFASSGVLWRPGIVVTAEHTIRRRDEIGITLPGGRATSATLAGRDPGTDLAVLKIAENGAPETVFGSTETLRRPTYWIRTRRSVEQRPLQVRAVAATAAKECTHGESRG